MSFKQGLFPLDGGREKENGRMSGEVCVRRVLAAVSGDVMAAGLQDRGQSF